MRIIVCLKQVPAKDSLLRVDDDGRWIRETDLSYEINEPDTFALEEGLRLKEKHGGEVVAACAGPARAASAIREALEFARERGAPILAELAGYGMSGDAYHMTSPPEDGDGAYRVMRNAVRDAGIRFDQIDYINAHGTSTPVGDRIETIAIKRTFGDHARKLAISSTKSMTGHLLGGAGGLEAGIVVLALRDQIMPPTINQCSPDPECDLDYVPNFARQARIEYTLSNSFGFGGTNGALVFKRF